MDKKEFRMLIKLCFLMGKNTVEAKQWLDKCYGDSALGKSTIIDWYAEFKCLRKTPMTVNAPLPKISNYSREYNGIPQNSFGRSPIETI